MDPNAIVSAALLALKAVLGVIAEVKGQSGLTDDQILAQAQTLAGDNDQLYATLTAALKGPTSPAS